MNKLELRQLLEEGEGYKIEFKEALSNLDKELAAFANKRVVESTTPKLSRNYPEDFRAFKQTATCFKQ